MDAVADSKFVEMYKIPFFIQIWPDMTEYTAASSQKLNENCTENYFIVT